MSLFERLAKPEYLLQPRRLVRRLLGRRAVAGGDGTYVLPLPWKLDLQVRQLDDLGKAVDLLGVLDLVVTEAIWRLVRPGDTVIDVGANVGYMSLAMMARLAREGRLFAFEPQPGVVDELASNIAAARARFPGVDAIVRAEALSDTAGTAGLLLPAGSHDNRGLAHIGAVDDGIPVPMRRLDEFAGELGPDVALMKIDVEGHEPAVLRGAGALLERGIVQARHHRGARALSHRSELASRALRLHDFQPRSIASSSAPRRSLPSSPDILASAQLARNARACPSRGTVSTPGMASVGGVRCASW